MEGVMDRVIEFYVPDSLLKKVNYVDRNQRGKLLEFPLPKRNPANSNSAQWQGTGIAYIAPWL
jgi:hypothetical protein